MKYFIVCFFLILSCEETHRYSSSEIAAIELSGINLVGKRPSLISEPFFVHEAIDNKLVDTPIRIIGKVEEVEMSGIRVNQEGSSLFAEIDANTSIVKESNLVLLEGVLSQKGDTFRFRAETIVILNDL